MCGPYHLDALRKLPVALYHSLKICLERRTNTNIEMMGDDAVLGSIVVE